MVGYFDVAVTTVDAPGPQKSLHRRFVAVLANLAHKLHQGDTNERSVVTERYRTYCGYELNNSFSQPCNRDLCRSGAAMAQRLLHVSSVADIFAQMGEVGANCALARSGFFC